MEGELLELIPGKVTVCDPSGVILRMNKKAIEGFAEDGGKELIGKNLLDCHPEAAQRKIRTLLETQETNVYTVEKKGRKKLVYQAPWHSDGAFAGFVELVLDIPEAMPHVVRD